MSLAIVAQPYAEPVTREFAKNHLKQDSDITIDDTLIDGQLTACRDTIETATGSNCPRMRTIMATTFNYYLDRFPVSNYVELPRVPLISVLPITYADESGDTQTVSTDVYSVDIPRGRIYLKYQQVWPVTQWLPNSITIPFVAGVAATFGGENTNTDTLTAYGRTLTNGDRVRLMNSGGALPTGLSALTDYFAVGVSGSTFQLSATSGGAAVDITAAGTGTQYLSADLAGFQTLRAALLLALGKLYRNRGDDIYSGAGSIDTTQRSIDSLVDSQHA